MVALGYNCREVLVIYFIGGRVFQSSHQRMLLPVMYEEFEHCFEASCWSKSFHLLDSSSIEGRDENHLMLSQGYSWMIKYVPFEIPQKLLGYSAERIYDNINISIMKKTDPDKNGESKNNPFLNQQIALISEIQTALDATT